MYGISLDIGLWALGFGLWALGFGLWALGYIILNGAGIKVRMNMARA